MSTAKQNLILALRKAVKVADAAFKESEHERAKNGQFGSGGGGGGGGEKSGGKLELEHVNSRHGKASHTPSGLKKSDLPMRDKNAISNTGKFSKKDVAERSSMGQKYVTNVLQGESGQFWVPATNREESILKRLGYKEAK